MATVDKHTADEIVAGKYKDDKATRIVRYRNIFNGEYAYGVTFDNQDKNLYFSPEAATLEPVIYWDFVIDGYGKARF